MLALVEDLLAPVGIGAGQWRVVCDVGFGCGEVEPFWSATKFSVNFLRLNTRMKPKKPNSGEELGQH